MNEVANWRDESRTTLEKAAAELNKYHVEAMSGGCDIESPTVHRNGNGNNEKIAGHGAGSPAATQLETRRHG